MSLYCHLRVMRNGSTVSSFVSECFLDTYSLLNSFSSVTKAWALTPMLSDLSKERNIGRIWLQKALLCAKRGLEIWLGFILKFKPRVYVCRPVNICTFFIRCVNQGQTYSLKVCKVYAGFILYNRNITPLLHAKMQVHFLVEQISLNCCVINIFFNLIFSFIYLTSSNLSLLVSPPVLMTCLLRPCYRRLRKLSFCFFECFC